LVARGSSVFGRNALRRNDLGFGRSGSDDELDFLIQNSSSAAGLWSDRSVKTRVELRASRSHSWNFAACE
jgi:hypothetical protein